LATLPTTEVNAFTYPGNGDLENVIAFDTQLFQFAYQTGMKPKAGAAPAPDAASERLVLQQREHSVLDCAVSSKTNAEFAQCAAAKAGISLNSDQAN
jgi:hypothetical protein